MPAVVGAVSAGGTLLCLVLDGTATVTVHRQASLPREVEGGCWLDELQSVAVCGARAGAQVGFGRESPQFARFYGSD